jgi:hypothetical protein
LHQFCGSEKAVAVAGELHVLYAHLGGVPAINGYSYLFRNG